MPKSKITNKSQDPDKIVDKVIEIIQFMGDNRLAEIELESDELKLSLKKHATCVQAATPAAAPAQVQAVAPMVVPAMAPAKTKAEIQADEHADLHKISSPMAGTFYRAPSPTSSPFVTEGDTVTAGQTVCIVEAMKMMNEIKADKSGKIVKILMENGQPVEKGADLFCIGE
jgi:acetyl-CoA carboxylase biotin carboxyl carrier protein